MSVLWNISRSKVLACLGDTTDLTGNSALDFCIYLPGLFKAQCGLRRGGVMLWKVTIMHTVKSTDCAISNRWADSPSIKWTKWLGLSNWVNIFASQLCSREGGGGGIAELQSARMRWSDKSVYSEYVKNVNKDKHGLWITAVDLIKSPFLPFLICELECLWKPGQQIPGAIGCFDYVTHFSCNEKKEYVTV